MHALVWIALVLFGLGLVAWLVLKVSIAIAVVLFFAGVIALVWGLRKAKKVVKTITAERPRMRPPQE